MSNTRRFSLEEDFMNFKTNDLLYGFMRSISSAMPDGDKYKEYLYLKKFQEEKQTIAKICDVSSRTINNQLTKLIECGLVEEGKIKVEGHEYPCFFFPYDYDGKYKLIEKEMVSYLVATRNSQAIRVYLYLLNCSTQKENYVFTVQEIKKALGYSSTTKTADKMIGYILESFQKEGLLRVEREWFDCVSYYGNQNKTERMVLKFVATKKSQF